MLIKEFKKDDKDKNDKLYDADGELPQALIHFETALVPVAAKGEGFGKLAKESECRFLSALANESIDELLSGEGAFNDNLENIKSRLIGGNDK